MKTMRSFLSLLTLAIAPALVAQSSGTTVLEGIDRRPATSLNGEWHTIVAPCFAGYFNFHHEMRTDGFYRNAPLEPDSTLPGGGAKAGLHGTAGEPWTEEFQATLYKHQLAFYVLQKTYKDRTIGSAAARP